MSAAERDRRPWARPGVSPRTPGRDDASPAKAATTATPPETHDAPERPAAPGRSGTRAANADARRRDTARRGRPRTRRPLGTRRTPHAPTDTDRSRASRRGIRTVAAVEVRSAGHDVRRLALLAGWVAGVYGMVALAWSATSGSAAGGRGAVLHGITTFTTLGLGLVVAPALTATSLSSDRRRRTLETWLTSRLTPHDVALGVLAGAATLLGVGLALVLPAWIAVLATGGIGIGGLVGTVVLVGVCLVTSAAVALACSARGAGRVTPLLGAYAVTVALTLGTVAAFGAATTLTARPTPRQVIVADPADPLGGRCVTQTQTRRTTHTRYTWWLLAPNPFVVVADAVPARVDAPGAAPLDPLTAVHDAVRSARRDPGDAPIVECTADTAFPTSPAPMPSTPSASSSAPPTAVTASPGVAAAAPSSGAASPEPTASSTASPSTTSSPAPIDAAAADGTATQRPGPVWPYGVVVLLVVTAACVRAAGARLRTPATRAHRPLPSRDDADLDA